MARFHVFKMGPGLVLKEKSTSGHVLSATLLLLLQLGSQAEPLGAFALQKDKTDGFYFQKGKERGEKKEGLFLNKPAFLE